MNFSDLLREFSEVAGKTRVLSEEFMNKSLQATLMNKRSNQLHKILESVIKQIEQSKLRAFSEVNKALLQAYWNIGKELSKTSEYGKAVVERLSNDLRVRFPGIEGGYSVANLWYMKKFYEAYPILQLAIVELPNHQKIESVTQKLQVSQKLQPLTEELKSKTTTGGCRIAYFFNSQTLSVELLFSKLEQ